MDNFYTINLLGLKRELPIISIGPKIRIASFNLLGDRDLVNETSKALAEKIGATKFDYLVGAEVKVVPVLHMMSNLLMKDKYVVCRKQIKAYMVKPLRSEGRPTLVLDGRDADVLRGKKVIVVDDVVSTGNTFHNIHSLMNKVNASIVMYLTIFKQGETKFEGKTELSYLAELPVFMG